MIFENRVEAARLLARRLGSYRGRRPLVLAIPRGAVPMGRIVAEALDGDLDVVLVRKLRAADNPELAIGSIDETGRVHLEAHVRDLWSPEYLEREKHTQLQTLRMRRDLYRRLRPPLDPAGRVVIVLDDGIATGSTMIGALRAVRARRPDHLVAATAVAPPHALRRIEREADEVSCLDAPPMFWAIGNYFRDFAQVSDQQVVAALEGAVKSREACMEVAAPAAGSGSATPSATQRPPPR
jgi:predicted phosphoribosyltransferase